MLIVVVSRVCGSSENRNTLRTSIPVGEGNFNTVIHRSSLVLLEREFTYVKATLCNKIASKLFY